jgi:hypothetical protein
MHGYQNFTNVKKDPDLENARKQAAFKPLVKQFEKKPRTASREVLGEMVSMCDTCAAVLASTSTEAEKQATGKNVCEQCLKNRAVVKAKLPDGSAMRLCSECAQSISPGATTSAAGDSVRHSGEQTPLARGPSNPTLGGPPPVAPRRPSTQLALGGGGGGGDDDDGPPPPGPEDDDDDPPQPPAVATSGEHAALGNGDASSDPPSNGASGVHDDDVPPPEHVEEDEPHEPAAPVVPAGPRRPVGAVAIMPGLPTNFAPLRARPGATPAGGPGAPARRMVAQRGAPPVASRGAPPPGAEGAGRGPPPGAGVPGRGPPPGAGNGAARGPPTPVPRGGAPPPGAAARGGAPPPAARRSLPTPAAGRAPAAAPLSGSAEAEPPVDDDAAPPVAAAAAAVAAAPAAATPAAADGGELPAGWKEFVDKKTGRKYYHAASTKETVWVRPTQPVAGAVAAAAGATAATAAAANEPLPAGWQEFTDKKTGRKYYYCASTKETVWVRPGPEKAVAGAAPAAAKPAPAAAPVAAAAAAAAPAAAAVAPAAAASPPAAAKAAGGGGALAPGWVEYMDKKRGLPYYYNKMTKETVWVRPVADEPDSNGMTNVTTITAAAAAIDSDDEDGAPPAQPIDDDDSDDLPTIEAGGVGALPVDEFDEE